KGYLPPHSRPQRHSCRRPCFLCAVCALSRHICIKESRSESVRTVGFYLHGIIFKLLEYIFKRLCPRFLQFSYSSSDTDTVFGTLTEEVVESGRSILESEVGYDVLADQVDHCSRVLVSGIFVFERNVEVNRR